MAAIEKVIIICKTHGPFKQTPNSHLSNGCGCKICSGCYKSNTEEFITKAQLIHGTHYDYSLVDYKTVDKKVTIVCKSHGPFELTPNNHLTGNGCFKCGHKMFVFTNEDFIKESMKIHGNLYDYSLSNYTKMGDKLTIICQQHGPFEQTPSNHITHLQGCGICGGHYNSNTDEFIEKATNVHGTKYNYSKVDYTVNSESVIIGCDKHGDFLQQPRTHLSGSGCDLCGNIKRSELQKTSINEFVYRSNVVHNFKYDYSLVVYETARLYVNIMCLEHGVFEQIPDAHLRGSGCPTCTPKFSKSQIKYLCFMSLHDNIKHAENGGEYKIPGTRWKADGYCEENNTIYEFHGDFWHGNPKLYSKEMTNPFSKKTFGELYENTLMREQKIRELGYNLVVMWESDWNKLNKSVKAIQTKFRKLFYKLN